MMAKKNQDLRNKILSSQLHQSGAAFNSARLAGDLREPAKSVGQVLGYMADEGIIHRLESTTLRGNPMFCKRKVPWLRVKWDRFVMHRIRKLEP